MTNNSASNLFARFLTAFPADRQRPCLTTGAGVVWSYADLLDLSRRMAGRLRHWGLRPGDRVTVQIDKSVEALCVYLACLQIGAIYMPLNSGYTLAELAYFIGDAAPSLILCRGDAQTAIASLAGGARVATLDIDGEGDWLAGLADQPVDMTIAPTARDDIAAMLYTSGTTGRAKGAMLTHGNLISNAETLTSLWGFSDQDVLLHALPIFHVHGLFVALGCAFLSEAKLLFLDSFDVETVVQNLPQATVFMGVPTYYSRLLARPELTANVTSTLRLFVSGSAPLLPDLFERFAARTGQRILERYGMTETGMICSNPLQGERRVGTVGLPLPGVELRITDAVGQPVASGETGQVEVRGPNVLKGYWNNPDKTAAAFRDDGFFLTGDIGFQDQDGYLHLVGRASDMIITGGYNVYPKEIETILDRLPGIAESAVFGVPHPDFGEAVVAAILGRDDLPAASPEAILASLKQELAGYKIPKRILPLEQLPRNTMGKVVKASLRQTFAHLFSEPPP